MTEKELQDQAADRFPYLPAEQFDLEDYEDTLTYGRMVSDTDKLREGWITCMKEKGLLPQEHKEKIVCPECKGEGKIWGKNFYETYRVCEKCDGTGKQLSL